MTLAPAPTNTRTDHAPPILRRLAPFGRIAEVGVLRGRLSDRLLTARSDIMLLMVDPWSEMDEDGRRWSEANNEPCGLLTAEQHEDNHRAAVDVARRYSDRATIIRQPSPDVTADMQSETFDMVFLDGDHREHAVDADLSAWWPLVRPGGWIAGHDYETSGMGTGVKAAADRFCLAHGLKIELDAFFTWFARKPGGAA